MKRSVLAFALVTALVVTSCGGGGGTKPCRNGTDPAGRACTNNNQCAVKCVCQDGSKYFRITSAQCRADNTCYSADYLCTTGCLLALSSWTGNFCNP